MIIALVKFGQEKFIVDQYSEEYLFFKNLKYFRKAISDSFGRFDNSEGNIEITQGKELTITSGNKRIELHKISRNFNVQLNKFETNIPGNICSLHSLEVNLEDRVKHFSFDQRLFAGNNKALLIFNVAAFFELLDEKILQLGYGYGRKKVIYYDKKETNGELSYYHKDSELSFQNEYRIYLETPGKEDIRLEMPGLQKMSMPISLDKLITLRMTKK